MATTSKRSLKYKSRSEPRFGWYREIGDYVPFVFSYLTAAEWKIIEDWFEDTEQKHLIGESSVPFMSMLQSLIMGNALGGIVQLGHYAGFSSLLIGFMLRKMGKKHGLFSIDIDKMVSDYTQEWVTEAGLEEYVHIEHADSTDSTMPTKALEYLQQDPQMVIIDSSHQYVQTMTELDMWYAALQFGGFMILHDTSELARDYDSRGEGGVKRAFEEWTQANEIQNAINIWPRLAEKDRRVPGEKYLYTDPCGIGIIQK